LTTGQSWRAPANPAQALALDTLPILDAMGAYLRGQPGGRPALARTCVQVRSFFERGLDSGSAAFHSCC